MGADVNARTRQGDTLLHFVVPIAFSESEAYAGTFFYYLLEHHADPTMENDEGLSPMEIAHTLHDDLQKREPSTNKVWRRQLYPWLLRYVPLNSK